MSEIDLLPRADLPVIWNEFKTKAETLRETAENLNVTSIDQKEDMALARKTRLTLREIRIAVEHKRVELGEGHLKEIQKVNGAAKAIREFIEPLEARLLVQEEFAERAEEKRIVELTKSRNAELESVRLGSSASNTGNLSQADYDIYITRLRAEKAELEEANRLRVEAEKQLAEVRAEAQKRAIELQLELKAESDRLKAEAFRVAEIARAEKDRRNEEAELVRFEQEKKHREELSAALAIRTLEREAAEKRRQADLQIEREKTAKLEAELAQERAAKQAEEKRLRDIEVAPDVEKLRDFVTRLQGVSGPVLTTREGRDCFGRLAIKFNEMVSIVRDAFGPE